MGYVLQKAIDAVVLLLSGPSGIKIQLEQMAQDNPELADSICSFTIRGFHLKQGVVSDEDLSGDPRIRVQVNKLVNDRRLKYASFSGTCGITLLVEASDDRQELVTAQLNAISDAILLTLDNQVGCLRAGVYYGGGYELSMQPMERGGDGFRQVAQVKLELAMDEGG